MSDQTMKILKMLEEGRLSVEEADRLLAKIQELEGKEAGAERERRHPSHPGHPGHPGFQMPHFGVPPIPDVGRIVSESMPDVGQIVGDAMRDAFGPGSPFGQPHGVPKGDISLKGVRFQGARLDFTDFTDVKLDNKTRLEGANLAHASFVDADLRGADLRGADLSHSNFHDAKLQGADLRGARLSNGTYVDADFRGAVLHGADLSLSNLTDADFKGVKEAGLSLRGVTMVGLKYRSSHDDEEPEDEDAWAHDVEEAESKEDTWAREAEASEEAAGRAEESDEDDADAGGWHVGEDA
jgi:hypothetical protein